MKKLIPVANINLPEPSPVTIPVIVNPDELSAYLARVHDAHTLLNHLQMLFRKVDEQQQHPAFN